MKKGRVSILIHLTRTWTFVNRALLRCAYLGARAAWRVLKPKHHGAVVALWRGDRLLMVHQTYRRCWLLPGGGIGRRETPEEAARRELKEELALEAGTLQLALVTVDRYEHRLD